MTVEHWGTGGTSGSGGPGVLLPGGPGGVSPSGPAGAGGGGPAYYPTDPNTREFGTMLQVVSEGPIVGLVDGLKSVFLDGTPILSSTGSKNFTGIALALTAGTNTQAMIPGFVDSESETSVNVQVKHSTGPVTRTISTPDISAIRVRLSVPSLKVINPTTGAESGWDINMQIERQSASYTPPGGSPGDWEIVTLEGGGWIYGKFGSKYTKSFRVETPAAGPWTIKVSRISIDHTGGAPDYIQDESWWDAYTEITDVKLRHPFSALAALRVDAKQFQSIPRLTMDIKGRIIKIPSNYNPTTRAYTGIWDGTFVDGWTDNPAWIWYDMATHTRYGAGSFLDASRVDKWSLYTIAQACDVMVSDGKGGTEPRFRCSLYIQNQVDAIKLLQEMASIFRGMIYWAGGVVSAVQDADVSPSVIFTNSNVKDGRFTYQGSARKSRHTAALVSWQDPNNGYETSIEYVEDHAAIARYGFNSTSISALGATSQAQARRLGLWTLLTETMDTEVVTFSAGLEGSTLRPGDIIATQDQFRAAQGRFGGRVLAGASTTVIPLDGPTVLPVGTNTLSVRLPSGLVETRNVTTAAGTVSSLTVSPAFSAAPQTMAQWALNVSLYRVLGIKKGEGIYYEIAALQHTPSKYALIDTVTVTPGPAVPVPVLTTPASIVVSDTVRIERDKVVQTLSAYWTGSAGALYVAEASQDGSPWKPMEVNATSAILDGITSGVWRVRVQAIFASGTSSWAVSNHTVAPPSVTGTDAGTAVTGVNQINSVNDLSNQDKIQLRRDWDAEQQIKTQLDTQASTLGVSAAAYDNAVAALSTGLIAAGAPAGWATAWPDGTTFTATSIVTNLRTWWTSIALNRDTLRAALTAKVQANAAYADAMARSSYNLIKNGNSEDANPQGYEALGVDATGYYTGTKCRKLGGQTGNYPELTMALVPCAPGDQFHFEAMGARSSAGSGDVMIAIVFYSDAAGTAQIGYGISPSPGPGTTWTSMVADGTAPAGSVCVRFKLYLQLVPTGTDARYDNLYACRKISAGMIQGDAIQTSNYAETSGNPTAGARMDISGTSLKTHRDGLQIGTTVFSEYLLARIVQGFDGTAAGGRIFCRNSIDSTTRGGAPNIACLTITQRDWGASYNRVMLEFKLQPTNVNDNLDVMEDTKIVLYRQSAAGTTATLSGGSAASTYYLKTPSRKYRDAGTDSNTVNASLFTMCVPDIVSASGFPACLITLNNVYGPSDTNCFYSGSSAANGVALVNNGPNWPAGITGGTSGGSGIGGGSAGGACPAPWVKILLASGLLVDAGDLYNGAVLAGVNDSTLEPMTGVVSGVSIEFENRVPIILEDGSEPEEFSLLHRLAVDDRGWVAVKDLRAGDSIVAQRPSIVKGLGVPFLAQVVKFQVDGCHTYFAGKNGFLSHNMKALP